MAAEEGPQIGLLFAHSKGGGDPVCLCGIDWLLNQARQNQFMECLSCLCCMDLVSVVFMST